MTEGVQQINSKKSIATVSDSGLVTAKISGTATITFKNSIGTKSASCNIKVIVENIIIGGSGYTSQLRKHDSNGNLILQKTCTDKNSINGIITNFVITNLDI